MAIEVVNSSSCANLQNSNTTNQDPHFALVSRAFSDTFSKTTILKAEGVHSFGEYFFNQLFDANKLVKCTFDDKSQKFTLLFQDEKQIPINHYPPSLEMGKKQIPCHLLVAKKVVVKVAAQKIHFEAGCVSVVLPTKGNYGADLIEITPSETSPDILHITPKISSSVPFLLRMTIKALKNLSVTIPAQEVFDTLYYQ